MRKKEVKLGRVYILSFSPYLRMLKSRRGIFQLRFGFKFRKYADCWGMETTLREQIVKDKGWDYDYFHLSKYDIHILTCWKDVNTLEDVDDAIEDLKSIGRVELYKDYREKALAMLLEALE